MQTTVDTITEIFAALLKKPGLKLALTDSPDTVTGWDSLTHPELITAIEEKLDIDFDFKELASIKNIADLVSLIESKQF
ncbi:MAG: acyl carrier protein [Bacteroidales bacterium]|nr:acyl carrier protein [Bacteroidales bacterium]